MEEQREIVVHVETCRDGITLPRYANPGDAGMDVCAGTDVLIAPGESKIVPTGLKIGIPGGYEIQVRPRSGLSLHTPLRLANTPGTIDSGYRDELGIIVYNASCAGCAEKGARFLSDEKGNRQGSYYIQKGDRIAQLVIAPVYKIKWKECEDIETIGGNRGGGFGSTGV